jgi:NAD(P)-dependent dehydrogenase (short-subunit alcohol dehydrogenase family)
LCAARGARCAAILARRGTEAAGGRIDILVNNAGGGAFGPTAGFGEDAFDATFGTNVKAPFYLVGDIAPAMAERGQGAIVNVVTMAAQFGVPGMAVDGPARRP